MTRLMLLLSIGRASQVQQAAIQFDQNLALARQYASLDGTLLQTNLGAATPGNPFADYDPPGVDALSIQREHAATSERFEQDIAVSLDAFEQARSASNSTSGGYGNPFSSNST
jgi:hypothetical protein